MEILVHFISELLYLVLIFPVAIFSLIFYALAVKGVKKNKPAARSKKVKKWPTVTIQIPTKDELVAIRCAKKCLNFDYPKSKFHILIGDDSMDPVNSKKLKEFAKNHKNVRVTRRGNNIGFKPGNLNHMLKYSKGEILVIFDSDFIPKKNFLKKIVTPFTFDKKIACVQAKWDYMNIDQNRTSKFASALLMVYHRLIAPINNRLGIALLFGSGEAVRKSVVQKLGGWKEWAMTEDVEFSLRAIKNGYKTIYLENVVVPGEVPFTADGLAKQQKRWAYGNTKAFFDNIRWMMFGKRFSIPQKLLLFLTLIGYVSAPILVLFIIIGSVLWFTGTPGLINVSEFSFETSKIMIINSGFLVAMLVALFRENKLRIAFSVVVASITVGLWVSLSVFDGFMKAITRHKMSWYMIRKTGNETIPVPKI
ncbi:MAG: glycosyltransferase family 2 protein [Candidatus Aenigmatarchaeota archaeon]